MLKNLSFKNLWKLNIYMIPIILYSTSAFASENAFVTKIKNIWAEIKTIIEAIIEILQESALPIGIAIAVGGIILAALKLVSWKSKVFIAIMVVAGVFLIPLLLTAIWELAKGTN